jgi:hypothetical protein
MIMVAGPYRSGTNDDPEKMAANVRAMEEYALPLFRAGHIPIVGEWLALPMVALAGSRAVGDEPFNEIFHPIAERLLDRCDAILRSAGRRREPTCWSRGLVKRAESLRNRLSQVPGCETERP